jgi:hypothetical protein
LLTGKDGALTIEEWVTSLKDEASHLFPGSGGSGGSGGRGGMGGDMNQQLMDAAKSGDMKQYRAIRAKMKENAG